MFLESTLVCGAPFQLVIVDNVATEINQNAFRLDHERNGDNLPLAGNFCAWSTVFHLLRDHAVLDRLTPILSEWAADVADSKRKDGETLFVNLDMGTDIGWSGSASMLNYHVDDTQYLQLPNAATARFVVRGGHFAPRTASFTLECRIVFSEERGWVFYVNDVYTGRSLGNITGDVTRKMGIVFFPPDCPGA